MSAFADLNAERIEGLVRTQDGIAEMSVPLISHIGGNLYMGGCIGGVDLPTEIEHVVSLYSSAAYRYHPNVRSVLAVRMDDVAERPDEAFVWALASHVNTICGIGRTLVHCQAGLNRSGLISALALRIHGYTADDAIALLRERRSPLVLCNSTFEAFVRESPVIHETEVV